MRRLVRSTASQGHILRRRWPTNVYISLISSAFHSRRWAFFSRKRDKGGPAAYTFFASLATIIHTTPVTRTMLYCELRSTSSFSTCA